jgi:hypothetical protein
MPTQGAAGMSIRTLLKRGIVEHRPGILGTTPPHLCA